jgi:ribosomal protein S18 acetylase RimI-like enzyme
MPSTSDQPSIAAVASAQWAEALALVLWQLPEEERRDRAQTMLAAARAGDGSLEGLLGAYHGPRLVGVALSQIQPGKIAAVWMPRAVPPEPESTASKLLAATCQWLEHGGVRMAQILTETYTPSEAAMLRRWGFDHLADLLYLVSLEGQFPQSPPPTQLEFEPYGPHNHDRFTRTIEATYRQTLDCPGLNGVRSIEDVLAGYQGAGVFDPRSWLLVRRAGEDVGCLLLTDHPQYGNYELVYMGVIPAVRGHAWGIEIAQYAQWRAHLAGRPRLVLAVDASNRPAIGMYAAVGFEVWDRRSVFLKLF